MTIEELHYNFKLRLHNLDSAGNASFLPAQIDEILNNAIRSWASETYQGVNKEREGFEESVTKIDELSPLVIRFPEQVQLVPQKRDDIYELDFSNLIYPYFHFVEARAFTKCKNKLRVVLRSYGELEKAFDNIHTTSSIKGGRVLAAIGKASGGAGSSLYLYPNNFEIENVRITYLKQPATVCLGGYQDILDGEIKVKVETDIHSAYHDKILDIATSFAAIKIQDNNAYQLSRQKINTNE